jgi:hypothetical protein
MEQKSPEIITLGTSEPEFQGMVETLTALLREQLKRTEVVSRLLRKRLEAEARGDLLELEACLEEQAAALFDLVMVERERIAALAEIGLALGHRQPSRMRLAELIHYLSPESRDELLDIREELRDVADLMQGLSNQGSKLERHRLGRVTLYLTPAMAARMGGDCPSLPRPERSQGAAHLRPDSRTAPADCGEEETPEDEPLQRGGSRFSEL